MKRRRIFRPALLDGPDLPGCILMLDIGSLKCGWAWARLDVSGKVIARKSGVELIELHGPVRWRRVDYFARWLSAMIKTQGITWLAAEEPFTLQTDSVACKHLLHGLFTICDVISGRLWGRPVHPVSRLDVFKATVGWVRKPLTPQEMLAWQRKNKRKSLRPIMRCPSKLEVMQAVNARHAAAQGRRITSEDESDAVAALDLILAELAGTGIRQAPVVRPTTIAKLAKSVAGGSLFKSKLRVARRPDDAVNALVRRQIADALGEEP